MLLTVLWIFKSFDLLPSLASAFIFLSMISPNLRSILQTFDL